jgi:exodeoxyribonuclease V alpha subunit
MVDLPNLYRLLMRMGDGCRLLLVGDNAQLPPIGFGLVLHQLVDVPGIPLVRLVRIHRQAAETGIPVVAGEIRAGRLPLMGGALEGKGSGVVFLPGSGPNRSPTLQDVVDAVSTCGGWSEDIRILCPTKRSEAGTESVNAHFHSLLRHGRMRMRDPDFAVGEPVMFLRNDYRLGLRNGSLGIVTDILENGLEAEFDGVRHELVGAKLDDLTLAYGITVHKAQGSAFSRVVIPIAQSRLLDRSLIYTAVTRARDQVVLIGDTEAFERAVTSSANAHRRIVGLRAVFEAQKAER